MPGKAVRCASRSAEKSPATSTPCPSCGVVAATQQGPHLVWVSFRNGLDVRMEGEGGMHRHPHFPVSATVGTLFGQTDTVVAVSLICITSTCFADTEPSHSLLRGHLPLCCNYSVMAIYQQMVSELHKARSLPLSGLYTPGSSACWQIFKYLLSRCSGK